MLAHFVGMVCGATTSAVTAFQPFTAQRFNAWLEPLRILPPDNPASLMREFCIATVDVGIGEFRRAIARYESLCRILERPLSGVPRRLREQTYLGSLHGLAQSKVMESDPSVLALADQLAQGSTFFAPHAELVRAGYYWYRGEHELAEQHRTRAELLALRGGTSWSAVTLVTGRRAHGALLARDPVALTNVIGELERLSGLSDSALTFLLFCQGWLAYLRGQIGQAVRTIEPLMSSTSLQGIGPWRIHAGLWAELLNADGQHERARSYCQEQLAAASEDARSGLPSLLLSVQLALAEAQLGALEPAIARVHAQIAIAEAHQNPLERGTAYHGRARLAIARRDAPEFEQFYEQAVGAFRATGAASLQRVCDELVVEAQQAGLRRDEGVLTIPHAPSDQLDGSTVVQLVSPSRA
jgi:tetratricopeptide (TPR) repeat protein